MTRLTCILLLVFTFPAVLADTRQARHDFFEPGDRARKFQTAERIFPYRTIKASDKVHRLERHIRAAGFTVDYEFQGRRYNMTDFNERTRTNALLILKDGKLVSEIYRNGANDGTRFISFSMGKSVTSTLVGMAIEDGYIESVEDDLTRYLPALRMGAYEGVTIKDALQMLSGVEWNEEAYDFSDMTKPLIRLFHESLADHRYRFVEGANELGRSLPPGRHFNYSTMETCILGWLVENATQRRFSTYLQERLWIPAGMESDAAWILDGPEEIGREMAGGMLLASLRDYGRFGLLFMNDGRANDRQLVSAGWVRDAITADREPIRHGNLMEGYDLGYGYQWWLMDNGRYGALGVFGQFILVAPDENVVIVKLSYWPEPWSDEMESETYAFFDAVVQSLKSGD